MDFPKEIIDPIKNCENNKSINLIKSSIKDESTKKETDNSIDFYNMLLKRQRKYLEISVKWPWLQ